MGCCVICQAGGRGMERCGTLLRHLQQHIASRLWALRQQEDAAAEVMAKKEVSEGKGPCCPEPVPACVPSSARAATGCTAGHAICSTPQAVQGQLARLQAELATLTAAEPEAKAGGPAEDGSGQQVGSPGTAVEG